jgi:hypothetical protein
MQYRTVSLPILLIIIKLTNSADDLASFNAINMKLLNQTASPLRHIPLRIYIPSQAEADTVGSFKIVQSLVTPRTANRKVLYLRNQESHADAV